MRLTSVDRATLRWLLSPYNPAAAVTGSLESGPVVARVPESVRVPVVLAGSVLRPRAGGWMRTVEGREFARRTCERRWRKARRRA